LATCFVEIVRDHFKDKLIEACLRVLARLCARFARVSEECLQLGRSEVGRVNLNESPARLGKRRAATKSSALQTAIDSSRVGSSVDLYLTLQSVAQPVLPNLNVAVSLKIHPKLIAGR
jgi:hypothetical protein